MQKLEKNVSQIETSIEQLSVTVEKQNSYMVAQAKNITQEYLDSYKDDFV